MKKKKATTSTPCGEQNQHWDNIYDVKYPCDIPKPGEAEEPGIDAGESPHYSPAQYSKPQIFDYDDEGDYHKSEKPFWDAIKTPIPNEQTILPRNKVNDREAVRQAIAYFSDQSAKPKTKEHPAEERQILLPENGYEGEQEEFPEYGSRDDPNDTRLDVVARNVVASFILENDPIEIDLYGQYKIAWTVPELVDASSALSKKYKGGCTAKFTHNRPKMKRWAFRVVCGEDWSDPAGHVVKAKFTKTKNIIKGLKTKIHIACSCPFWIYYGADWNSLRKDYSERQMGSGAAPTVRGKRHLICKHVAACIPLIKNLRIK